MAPEYEEARENFANAGHTMQLGGAAASHEEKGFASSPPDPDPKACETAEMDEDEALKQLAGTVRDQDDLARDITTQASAALMETEDKKDEARIDKLMLSRHRLQQQLDKASAKIEQATHNVSQARNLRNEIIRLEKEIRHVTGDIVDFQARIKKRHDDEKQQQQQRQEDGEGKEKDSNEKLDRAQSKRLPGEGQREYLIRTGKITPFAKIGGPRPAGIQGQLADIILDAEEEAAAEQLGEEIDKDILSHKLLRRPGFAEQEQEPDEDQPSAETPLQAVVTGEFSLRPRKRRRAQRERSPSADYQPESSSSDVGGSGIWQQGTEDDLVREERRRRKARKAKAETAADQDQIDLSKIDDGNEAHYKKRLRYWVDRRSRARRNKRSFAAGSAAAAAAAADESDEDEPEWFKPAPRIPDYRFTDDLRLPGDIHPSLFGYQKTGVQWLAELYKQNVGGIVGDEMGLGKTVQLIAFLAALHYSKRLTKPVIVVAPATLLRQWVSEFHRWWPPLRVAILHSSGSGMLDTRYEDEYDLEHFRPVASKSEKAARRIVDGVRRKGGVLVTTYTGLQTYAEQLLPIEWEYAVLDEGHKIRNPNAEITVTCKELNTPNRVILSGTPVQNNLTELWSLFDFIYPMRLGTLVNFRTQFEIPIRQGGYANASNLQVMTAEKCAEALKETISEYLLQRLKMDVAADLPEKTEQVLFCKLTEGQRRAYETFLGSDEVSAILNRRRQSLYGIDILRKICNHPDLLDKSLAKKPGYDFGNPRLSAKLQLTKDLLQKVMIPNGHKTLLFSQGKQMLNIIEKCMRECEISHVRMDGETPVDVRQPMIDRFNTDPDIHVFLMTTRTGGLGTNLTGADRIIIFDPDWNPSTDLQARERAWRLGQSKPVKIYRLMTEGTIEEKIYHRQIFKQFMTNKVLKDPKQRSSYDLSDLYDLFSFHKDEDAAASRSEVFKGAEVSLAKKRNPGAGGVAPRPPPAKLLAPQPTKIDQGKNGRKDADNDALKRLNLVAAMEDFHEDPDAHEEKRMLEGIFAKSVNSAYDHEQIVNGPQKARADMNILRHEADLVARQAAAHLERSGEEARAVPIGTVTWTGEVGSAGRPGAAGRNRGGPSSAGIMSNLANRQGLDLDGGNGSGSGSSRAGTPGGGIDRNMRAPDFMKMIRVFITRQGGRVPSKMLVDHFNPYCPGKRQSDEFKTALESVAVLSKAGGVGRGMWTLRTF